MFYGFWQEHNVIHLCCDIRIVLHSNTSHFSDIFNILHFQSMETKDISLSLNLWYFRMPQKMKHAWYSPNWLLCNVYLKIIYGFCYLILYSIIFYNIKLMPEIFFIKLFIEIHHNYFHFLVIIQFYNLLFIQIF